MNMETIHIFAAHVMVLEYVNTINGAHHAGNARDYAKLRNVNTTRTNTFATNVKEVVVGFAFTKGSKEFARNVMEAIYVSIL